MTTTKIKRISGARWAEILRQSQMTRAGFIRFLKECNEDSHERIACSSSGLEHIAKMRWVRPLYVDLLRDFIGSELFEQVLGPLIEEDKRLAAKFSRPREIEIIEEGTK